MGYELANRISLSVYIEDIEVPFGEAINFNYLHISSGPKQALPYFNLSITDGARWMFTSGLLRDGNRVRLNLKSGDQEVSPEYIYEFRLASFREEPHTNGSTFTLEGALDVPKYFNTSSRVAVKGTSSEIMKQVASTVGLKYEGVGTNDSQVWLPMNRRLYRFVEYITGSGYATENSAMMSAVDLTKKLIYRDVTTMDDPKATLGLMSFGTQDVVPVVAVRPVVTSGGMNQVAGYRLTTVEQDLEGDTVHLKNEAVGTTINEDGDLLINSAIKSSGREGRVGFGPVDGGNTHDNFIRARHQNRRVLSFFSFKLEAVIPLLTNIQVLDTVTLDTSITEGESGVTTETYSGLYRVIGKVIYAIPGNIVEKIILGRRTIVSTGIPSNTAQTKASGSIITDTLSRVAPADFSIDSIANVPGFDLGKLSGMVSTFAAGGVASMAATAAGVDTGMSNLGTQLGDTPPVTPLLQALIGDINSITAAGVAAIEADLALDPGDLDNSVPGLVASYKTQINTAIDTQKPDIEEAAARALSTGAASKEVSASAATVGNGFDLLTAGINKGFAAMQAVAPPGSLDSVVAAGNASLAAGSTASKSSIASSTSEATQAADALLEDATTYNTQINDAKAAGYAALDAAAAG